MKPSFLDILQAPLKRLLELRLCGEFEEDWHRDYLLILLHYLSGECSELEDFLKRLDLKPEVSLIGLLRLQNMKNEVSHEHIRRIIELVEAGGELSAEASFALGMSYLRFRMNSEAATEFKRAYRLLTDQGAHQKAAKALLNVVVAESRIDNRRRLIQDYEVVAGKAKAAGATEVEGICYQNISKEMHILGLFELALKYSHQAVLLQEEGADSVHYYETILHRCHVLIDLGRFHEAYADFETAKLSRHPQTIEALGCIQRLLGVEKEVNPREVEPAWASKLSVINAESPVPTKLEMDFIDLVKGQALPKDEVILRLYGENTDWESAKNRFKVFLNRFRKKYPGIVEEENGHYLLVDTSVLTQLGKFS